MSVDQQHTSALDERESVIVRAAAEGVPFGMIADMDDVTVEEIHAICRRAVSKIRHPAYSPSSFTEDELEAARVLTACSDLVCD